MNTSNLRQLLLFPDSGVIGDNSTYLFDRFKSVGYLCKPLKSWADFDWSGRQDLNL
jgi:hypothetical protein